MVIEFFKWQPRLPASRNNEKMSYKSRNILVPRLFQTLVSEADRKKTKAGKKFLK